MTFFFFLKNVVSCVTAEYNRGQLWLASESFVIQLQARIRGYLVRKRHGQRMEYLRQQEPHVVKLQVYTKTVRGEQGLIYSKLSCNVTDMEHTS